MVEIWVRSAILTPHPSVFQEIDPYQQLEKLKVNKDDLLQKIATLKQQIIDIETQEDEALRGVSRDFII